MINLFLVVQDFSGARTYSDQLSKYMSLRRDITVYQIFFGSKQYSELTEVINENINYVYIPKNIFNKYDIKYSNAAALLIYIKYQKLPNIIFHLNSQDQFYFGKRVKELFKCPVVYTLHFLKGFYTYLDKSSNKIDFTEEDIFLDIIKLSDFIICVTEFTKRTLLNLYNLDNSRITVIYNGFQPIKNAGIVTNKKNLKKALGFNFNDRLLLYAGQLEHRKSVDTLLQVFGLLNEEYLNIKLIIAGSGNYDEYFPYTQNFPAKVIFTGQIPKEKLYQLYRIAEIGIIPSRYEQCSYIALEMMFFEVPLIISNVSGLNELVTHEYNGLVCDTTIANNQDGLEVDKSDLLSKIKRLLNEPKFARQLSRNAYKKFMINYSLDNMGDQSILIYNQLLLNQNG